MTPIQFATENGQLDSWGGTKERLVNLFAEKAPAGSTSDVIVRSTPGLSPVYNIGVGPIHLISEDTPTATYFVSGTHLWRLTAPGGVLTVIDMGDIGAPVDGGATVIPNYYTIATSTELVVVCSPPYAYAAKLSDTTVHRITGTADNPMPAVRSVCYEGGFFVFTVPDSSQFFISRALDPDTYEALDFAFADGNPNILLRAVSHLERVWLIGQNGIEIWYLSGDQDFPFRQDSGGVIPTKVLSGLSVAICDGSIFWMSIDGIVYRTNGYRAQRVSTHAIEAQIGQYFAASSAVPDHTILNAHACSYGGHICYVLTLKAPNDAGRTWCFDCATGLWHERSSTATGQGAWRVSCSTIAGLYGDSFSGKVFVANDVYDTDDDMSAARIGTSSPLWNATDGLFMARLQMDCEIKAPMLLEWTDDDGATWKGGRTLTLFNGRAFTTRLGSFRKRTLRMTIPSGQVRLFNPYALLEPGAS